MKSPTNNLVWYRNTKAASSTYQWLFSELGWTDCETETIDWNKDIVFGHIRDPLTRYRKGLVQFFSTAMPFNQEGQPAVKITDILNHPDYLVFVTRLRNIDRHCMTLEYMLGPLAKKVYWIPMDTEFDHKTHTLDLLQFFGEPLASNLKTWWLDSHDRNVARDIDLEFYRQLEKIPMDSALQRFLDFDQCIYDTARYYFLPQP